MVRLAAGKSNKAIGRELVIVERTVEQHLVHVYAKLGISSRLEAAIYAFQHGIGDVKT
jgi:DNA-binding NarL/FixJ family response regulator